MENCNPMAKGRTGSHGHHSGEFDGPSRLLRTREVAQYLAISERKLWELTNRGDIPCVRVGRAVRYDPADLQRWIEEKKRSNPKSVESK